MRSVRRVWLLAGCVALAACTGGAPVVVATAPAGHLLTELSAEVSREGVVLSWKVDETRAARITGFTCVYRTPSHIELGVAGSVACGETLSAPADRGRVVSGLPEYGGYLFEVTAQISGAPLIEWPLRALQVQLEVPRSLAGPPGPDAAVTGAGPMVTGCGPDGGRGETPAGRPWRHGDIVAAEHLTHYPGRAWAPGGDSDAAAEWPEPPPLAVLFDEAGLDGQILGRALDSASAAPGAPEGAGASGDADDVPGAAEGAGAAAGDDGAVGAALALLADDSATAPLARASAGTKALLRPRDGGGWDLKLHTSYPFGGHYTYEPDHAAPGWDDPGHPVASAGLWNRTDCPPPDRPDATHDVALAVSHDAGNARLEHSGYGWWAVAPVGMFPERVVATKGGLAFGDPASEPPPPPASWQGRVSGHLFANQQRHALAADVTLTLTAAGDGNGTQLSGRIHNVVIVPLDHATLEPHPEPPAPWPQLTLDAAAPTGPAPSTASQDTTGQDTPAEDTAGQGTTRWTGTVTLASPPPQPAQPSQPAEPAGPADPTGTTPPNAVAPDAFTGDWRAAAHGPAAAEITGELRLWTPLPPDGDPDTDWGTQTLLVAAFGATRTP